MAFAAFRKLPSGPGAHANRRRLFRRAISDDGMLDRMRDQAPLPPGYGVSVDERCVEYPWALAHLRESSGRLLDAGSVLNYEMFVTHPVIAAHELHILTFAPETEAYWKRGISYIFGDLRENPIRDGFYDTILSLSTLEHVGCDNSHYSGSTAHREARPEDYRTAIRELARVLKPGGTLLFSVPFGRYKNHGWLQIFDEPMVQDAIAAFGPASEQEVCYFRYTAAGWDVSSATACAGAAYASWLSLGPARPFWPTRDPDNAAAARAVACVRLVKAAAPAS